MWNPFSVISISLFAFHAGSQSLYAESSQKNHLILVAESYKQFVDVAINPEMSNNTSATYIHRFTEDLTEFHKLAKTCPSRDYHSYIAVYFFLTANLQLFLNEKINRCKDTATKPEAYNEISNYYKKQYKIKTFEFLKVRNLESFDDRFNPELKIRYIELRKQFRTLQAKAAVHPIGFINRIRYFDGLIRTPSNRNFTSEEQKEFLEDFSNDIRIIQSHINRKEIIELEAFRGNDCHPCDRMLPYILESIDRMQHQSEMPQEYIPALRQIRTCASELKGLEQLRLYRTLNYFRMYGNDYIAVNSADFDDPEFADFHSGVKKLLYQQTLFEKQTELVKSEVCID